MFFSTRSASFHISRPRSLADIFRQGPERSSNALRAASTARPTSSTEVSTTRVSTSPVAGLNVSNVSDPSSHRPSIRILPGLIFVLLWIMPPFPYRRLSRGCCPQTGIVGVLFRSERSGTFFHVRCQTLLGVVALEQQLLVFPLQRQRRLDRNLPSGLHRALDPAHRLGRLVGRTELPRVLHDVVHEPFALEDVIHNSKFLRFFKGESISGHHQLDGFALPYQA